MSRFLVAALIALIAVPAFGADQPKTDDQKALYAVGIILARQVSVFNLTPEEVEIVKQGLTDGSTGKTPLVDVELYKTKIQTLVTARRAAQGEKLAALAKPFVEKALKEKGAVKTASGLIYRSLREGKGASPVATDTVKVNYRGTLVDGKEFDSSYAAGKPVEFQLNRVIKCWTEGVQLMKVGGKASLICPPGIAYADRVTGMIPANATLAFEVELLDIVSPAPGASAPARPAASFPPR